MPSTSASEPPRGAHWDALAGRGFRSRAQAVSPFGFAAAVVPALLGAAAAGAQGTFAPAPFAVMLAAAGAVGGSVKIGTLPAPVIVLVFGPLITLGAYYVQTRTFDLVPLLYALPAGCLAAGLRGAPQRALLIGAYLSITVGAAAGTFVRWAVLPVLTAPLAWALVRAPAPAGDEAARARVHLVFGVLLAAGMLL